ncbi:MAG: hypothetical protein EOM20_15855 [Spartobacteria bacterium]|nr:hypothetical protein [Spartobacteria bacterium]
MGFLKCIAFLASFFLFVRRLDAGFFFFPNIMFDYLRDFEDAVGLMINRKLIFVVLASLSLIRCWALAPVDDDTRRSYEIASSIVARQLPYVHLLQIPCDDHIATNALNNFLNALDYDHTYFLAADIMEFNSEATNLDNRLRYGNVDFPLKVYYRFMNRVSNRVAYVNTLLDGEFDYDMDESYRWKRKEAPWPTDEAEWDDIWRKKVKNQLLARLISEQLAEEEEAEIGTNSVPEGGLTNELVTVEEKLSPQDEIRKQYNQYLEVLSDNDGHWLYPLFITSFVRAYDPHSEYMSANNTEDFDINMKLSLVGIGALLSIEDGAAKVVSLIPGGPAEQEGQLKPGDKIVAVGQGKEPPVDITHWPLSKSVRLIRGEKNTTVVLVVIPASDPSGTTRKKISIVRDEVKLEERAAKGRVEAFTGPDGVVRNLGIIRVPDFYADVLGRNEGNKEARSVTRDVERILKEFATNQVEGVVLDLRNNGGGLLNEAVEMTGLFIDSGPVVQVKSAQGVQVLSDADPVQVCDKPLVVLVNRQSASASEILAGALGDYGRAVIVGDSKTHGKGTVQSLISLRKSRPELGTLKFTTASFYRIAGGSTQMEGIRPDIVIPSMLDFMDIGEEYLNNPLPWSLVEPALYRQEVDIRAALPKLIRQSIDRREADEKFLAYEKLLKHLGEKQRSTDISLRMSDRLDMARREREMAELMKESEPIAIEMYEEENDEVASDEEEKAAADIILNETLNILSDLIVLEHQQTEASREQDKD